ncbi:MAG: V4R domain-containing protein [Aggregatilineales bacterium]
MNLPIPPSGYYYPNKIGRIYLEAIQEVIGRLALTDLLRRIGLERYGDALPPNNFQRTFDFADFSTLTAGLEQLQAADPHNPPVPYEASRLCFAGGMKGFGALAGFSQAALGFQVLPVPIKIKMGLQAMAMVFTTLSDQLTEVEQGQDSYRYVIRRCPMCWGRRADTPICAGCGALLTEGLHWVTQHHYRVTETECCAAGAETCTFVIDKTPLD